MIFSSKSNYQRGFAHFFVLGVFIILVVGVIVILNSNFEFLTDESINTNGHLDNNLADNGNVEWQFDMENGKWVVSGTPPECPVPLEFPSPANVNLASGVLYPGQVRGGDYKPHGGLRFDDLETNEVDVFAPMDARLVSAARHLESEEVQYTLYFINDCGIMYKLDHLLELNNKFNKIIETIPMGAEGDTRTTQIRPSVFVAKGEHIAKKIGFEDFNGGRNIFFDFGVYDLRSKNGVDYTGRNIYNVQEHGEHALCWLDYLEEIDKNVVKNLPSGGIEGSASDYCE